MKKVLLILIASLLLTSCGQSKVEIENNIVVKEIEKKEEKIKVTSSIIPISSIINKIWWEYVEVNNIVPAWVSPHGFDLSVKQRQEIEDSKIVFLVWLEHIDWFLEKAVNEEKKVNLSKWISLLKATEHEDHDDHSEDEHHDEHEEKNHLHEHDEHWHEDDEHHEEHDEDEEHEDEHWHQYDPHIWLWKENIAIISETINKKLTELLPEQEDFFNKNKEELIKQVDELYLQFLNKTDWKTSTKFIVFHDAYNYLMESIWMDLENKVVFSENVLHESGTAHIAELIKEVEQKWIKNIFKEPQFSDWLVEKFSLEYNLEIWSLDPIWVDFSKDWYLKNIESNINNISKVYE